MPEHRYNGTTFLLIAVQIFGWLAMTGAVLIFFNGNGPLVVPSAISGLIGGLVMVATASVGRVVVNVAEDIQNNLPGLMANQALQVVTTQALLETARANVK